MPLSADLLTGRARLTPDREALTDVFTGKRHSYLELNSRANRAANFLATRYGIGKGDRVSILAYNCIAYIDLFFGLGKLGAIFAPLNWRLTSRELAYIINDCRPRVLIVGPEFAGILAEMRASIQVDAVIALEKAQLPDAEQYEVLLQDAAFQEPESPDVDENHPACILYTSGTTGRPKGAVIPHRQVVWNAINTVISWGLTDNDVSPILTPMFHSGGLFVFLAPLLYAGGRIVLSRVFDADGSLALISAERCSVVLGVPTIFQVWINSPAMLEADFSHMRFFISGGAPCPPALIAAWSERTGVPLRQGYGLTEVGVNCFSMTNEEALAKAGSVGKPIFHSRARLVDLDGCDVARGETGELLFSGEHVSLGYWNLPDATTDVLKDGWFHTGDMARQDADGYFYIVGRLKDMIISGGENIYAAEVEAVFREHDAVVDAALIGIPDEKWGEIGLIFVALKPDASIGAEELRIFCAARLARFKIPARIRIVETLPYSSYGKVIKAELRKMIN